MTISTMSQACVVVSEYAAAVRSAGTPVSTHAQRLAARVITDSPRCLARRSLGEAACTAP